MFEYQRVVFEWEEFGSNPSEMTQVSLYVCVCVCVYIAVFEIMCMHVHETLFKDSVNHL